MEFDSKEKSGEKLDDIRDAAVKKRMRQEKGEEAEMEVLAWLKLDKQAHPGPSR